MALPAPAKPKINTNPTQPGRDRAAGVPQAEARRPAAGAARPASAGTPAILSAIPPVRLLRWSGGLWCTRRRVRGSRGGRCSPRTGGGGSGRRAEAELAAKLEKVTERLRADAPDMERPGADLIAHYLAPGRHPAARRWSRRHADTQRRLCERFIAPVIAAVTCQDIRVAHMQQIVNAAPTAGEGDRLRRCLSAMVIAGLEGGYLASPRLREVHWQAGDRAVPVPRASTSGESALWVDPAEIPADADVARLGQALAAGRRG